MTRDPQTKCMIRTFLVYMAVLVVGIAILVKAVLVQTKEGDELRALAEQVETRFDTLQASRGDILACDGSLLATDVPIFEIGVDPSVIHDTTFNKGVDQLSRKLAELFPKRNAAKWKQGLVEAKGNHKRYFLIDLNATLAQYQELETCSIFNQGKRKVGLTKSQPKFKRIHPYGSLASRTIGYVSDDKLVGLESACDTILRGKDGHRKQRHLHHGVWIPASVFSILRDVRLMSNALIDTLEEPEYVGEFLLRVFNYAEPMLDALAENGADGAMIADDWGTQISPFISPASFEEIFAPAYARMADACHKRGMDFVVHSCGYVYPLVGIMVDAGVDGFQFDQPELSGSRVWAEEFGKRAAFYCPVDIQKVLSTGDRAYIEKTAKDMCDVFRRNGGNLICKDYPSYGDIGVEMEWARWAEDVIAANSDM